MTAIKDGKAINISFIREDKAIEGVDGSGDKVDKVSIINTNSTKISKLVKSKELI